MLEMVIPAAVIDLDTFKEPANELEPVLVLVKVPLITSFPVLFKPFVVVVVPTVKLRLMFTLPANELDAVGDEAMILAADAIPVVSKLMERDA